MFLAMEQENLFPEAPNVLSDKEIAAVLHAAIAGGIRRHREADLYLSTICAEHLATELRLVGLVVVRPLRRHCATEVMPELPHGAPSGPVTPIGEVAKWEFRIKCRGCRRKVVLRVADISARRGPRLPIYQVVANLRCSGWTPSGTCGARPASVTLVELDRGGKSARVLREINVLPIVRPEWTDDRYRR
jgi:hypothetical protein